MTAAIISGETLVPVPGCSIRVAVCCPVNLSRTSLAAVLAARPGLDVIASVGTVDELLAHDASAPDVVVIRVLGPVERAVSGVHRLRLERPEVRVVVIVEYATPALALELMRMGAAGILLDAAGADAVTSCVETAAAGGTVLWREIAEEMLRGPDRVAAPSRAFDGLTAREVEILRLCAGGLANKQIARRLGISQKTVHNHVTHLYAKLGLHDRTQAVLYAVGKGLLPG